jgi:hypothetical protein
MTEPREPQIFGPIVAAVRPLVADGDFRLETIESYDGIFHILLSSPKIDLTFSFVHWSGGRGTVHCVFVEKGRRRYHGAGSLFSVFNIDIPVTDDNIWFSDDLPENTDTLQELSRISTAIKKNLPEILDLFRPERIEETYQRMLAESKKYHEIKTQERREREANKFPNFQDNFPLLVILFPALLKLEPQYPKHEEGDFWKRNLGTFEEVQATVGQNFHPRDINITYHGDRDTIDMQFAYREGNHGLGLIINQELDNTVAAYFLMGPGAESTFIKDRISLVKQQKMLIFPGRNVFRVLGIPYSYPQKGYLADLQELCRLIRDNSPVLFEAFSQEKKPVSLESNISRTYHALMEMEGNNGEEIQALIKHYFEEYFDVKNRPVVIINGKRYDPFGLTDAEESEKNRPVAEMNGKSSGDKK